MLLADEGAGAQANDTQQRMPQQRTGSSWDLLEGKQQQQQQQQQAAAHQGANGYSYGAALANGAPPAPLPSPRPRRLRPAARPPLLPAAEPERAAA